MGKNKLRKFADNLHFPNVFENFDPDTAILLGEGGREVAFLGRWKEACFGNDRPLILELACGRGEYSLALAKRYPDRNFLGIDVKGARIWKGASNALEGELDNVAFLRIRIEQITNFIGPGEVDEIWITFPDPFPRKSKANRRLPGPRFFDDYRKILRPGGLVHLKTDDPGLYEFTLKGIQNDPGAKVLAHSADIYAAALPHPDLDIQTYYEKMHLEAGKTIKYIQYQL
jgi:tRNA (guanine-N7-)-methyltransferase